MRVDEMNYAEMLREWSEATGGDPRDIKEWAELRVDLMVEEVCEWFDALLHFVQTGDARWLAKESADVQYILEGTALRPGVDLDIAFRIVHRSNMEKIHPDGSYRVREDGKILKPDGWEPPDMAAATENPGDIVWSQPCVASSNTDKS